MRILIFGNGQLGQAYREHLEAKPGVEVQNTQGVDIRDAFAVKKAIIEYKPDVVLNTAAKTNLDWCETHKLECLDHNTLGADTVAEACQENNIYLIHVSSGCVQESKTAAEARSESDPCHPLSFYSWTKVWAENLLMERSIRHNLKVLILRPRQLVSAKASPRNALTKLLTYKKFIDTPNSITVVEDLMEATYQLMQKNAQGIYNVANAGIMTPYRIAELLKEYVKPDMELGKISKEELNSMTLATRVDCVLDCSKLINQGIVLKDAEDRLRELLPIFKHNLESAADVLVKTQAETEAKLSLVK